MFMVLFAIFLVPKLTNEIIEILARTSVYSRMSYTSVGKKAKHVLITGDIRTTSLLEFFNELFHEDHENANLNAVVLDSGVPNAEMNQILRDPILSISVTYLQGSALNDSDLLRAQAANAVAIFILTDKFSTSPDTSDAKTILYSFYLKRHVHLFNPANSSQLFCTQLIKPENKRHLGDTKGLGTMNENSDLIVVLNEMKMGVIAKSCLYPGF